MITERQAPSKFDKECDLRGMGVMLQILVCDDSLDYQQSFRKMIHDILRNHKLTGKVHTYSNAAFLTNQERLNATDIFFLDVDLNTPGQNGLDVAKAIRRAGSDAVIVFVTNYPEFAVEGYEVQALRYLLKSKIEERLEGCLMLCVEQLKKARESVQLSIAGEVMTFTLLEILYMEADGHKTVICSSPPGRKGTKRQKVHVSLLKLEEQFAKYGFLRIQKSFIVNNRRIRKFRSGGIELDNGQTLPVSEDRYSQLKEAYLLWKGGL